MTNNKRDDMVFDFFEVTDVYWCPFCLWSVTAKSPRDNADLEQVIQEHLEEHVEEMVAE